MSKKKVFNKSLSLSKVREKLSTQDVNRDIKRQDISGTNEIIVKRTLRRKISIAITIILIIILIAVSIFYYNRHRSGDSPAQPQQVATQTEKPKIQDILLEDEWGLKIYYPEDLRVGTATGSTELTRYDFTHPEHEGKITIYSKETDAETIDEWITTDTESKDALSTLDTDIGGARGKKMRFQNSSVTRAVAVDNWQVFVFEVHPEKGEEEYWNGVFNSVLSKYEFLPFEDEAVEAGEVPAGDYAPSPVGGDVIEYEEEIIE